MPALQHRGRWNDSAAIGLRLVKEKGVNEPIDGFERSPHRYGFGIELLLAGNVRPLRDPRDEKAAYGGKLTKWIANVDGVRRVGRLISEAMHDFLASGNVFVMPFRWYDPFPTLMHEAAAAGVPIAAAACGGITGFLDSGPEFSFADDPADLNLLGSATARSVDSPRARDGGGRWPGTRVECEFDGSIVAGEIEHLYDGLRQPREAGK